MAEAAIETVEAIQASTLAGTRHGFLGRRGGVSKGSVSGLNVGLGAIGPNGDSAAAVAENRARAVAAVATGIGPHARLVTAYQVHSAECVVAGDWADNERPHADALVTDQPGLVLGILTADCAPVLFADTEAGVIGAAHAGWKGALGGITDSTVAAMIALGAQAERIVAAVGPCIAQASYEVDEGFRAHFCEAGRKNSTFFAAGRTGHWQFDLASYVASRLRGAGLTRVEILGLDTYAEESRFFSFRRATHRGEAAYGRQISLIGQA